MRKGSLLSQSASKRATAAALAEAKARNDWSNGDLGDALGCGEGTIRNRLDGDDPKHPMTVHELLRSIAADGVHIANAILSIVGHHVEPDHCERAPDAIVAAGGAARCAADVLAAAADGISIDEARGLLPGVVELQSTFAGFEARLRAILRGETS